MGVKYMGDEEFSAKDKLHYLAGRVGVKTHAKNIGMILAQVEKKVDRLENSHRTMLKNIANELGMELHIEGEE